jgi:uncharacterized protein YgbK (DUF1537 family)
LKADTGSMAPAEEYLSAQPPPLRIPDATARIRRRVERGARLAVLDDDPTGTQTVHNVPVLTAWSTEDLNWALRHPVFYVLTNSRSFPEAEAAAMNREIASRLADAAAENGTDLAVVSRSDSTLRGHFPAEPDALCEALEDQGRDVDGIILCPCFFEAGRLTVDDVQWVRRGDELVPAAKTEFAADASFSYTESNLKAWVEEKTGGRVTAGEVASVGLEDIRLGGPERVAEVLMETRNGQPVVVNAAEYADLELFVLGLLEAEAAGRRFVYRTGPSFVRARAGIEGRPPVSAEELFRLRPSRGHGLVLVGSHVEMTTRQLEVALALDGVWGIELSVPRLLDDAEYGMEVQRVSEEAGRALASSEVVVYTSRELVRTDELSPLEVGRRVSEGLVEMARRIEAEPASVVAKGGITSSDIATKALGARRAEVAGQMLPGIVPAWRLPEGSRYPGMPYVVFPGNVGGPDALARVLEILRGGCL